MAYIIFATCLFLTIFAGWVNNVIWLFHQDTFINVILGIVGVIAAPIGVVHGLYLFF